MIRVLQLPDSIERRNGRMSVIMNVYRKIDRSKIQFDFAATDFGCDNYKDEIERLGGRVYFLNKKENNIQKIRKLLKNCYLRITIVVFITMLFQNGALDFPLHIN